MKTRIITKKSHIERIKSNYTVKRLTSISNTLGDSKKCYEVTCQAMSELPFGAISRSADRKSVV